MDSKNRCRHLPAYIVIALIFLFSSCNLKPEKHKVLVFSKTSGYHHASIPAGNKALMQLGAENGFEVDTTTDASAFREQNLKNYAGVVFLNTTGDILSHYEEAEFERYIQAGGGFVGIHSATDTEYNWAWYGRMVGGYFDSHPAIQEANLLVTDEEHPATAHLPGQWTRTDEWYNFKELNKEVNVLIKVDEDSYEGGTLGDNHPIAWYHDYDGGRAFYTGLGHTEASYQDSLFLQHLLGGLQYAIGEGQELDYSKAKSKKVPEEERFVKTVLTQGTLNEPTEITVLPDLGVLVSERRGGIKYYNPKSQEVKQVGFLDVYYIDDKTGANIEEGLLGIAADPDFKNNHHVYIFYSPADTSVNRLSRFEFRNDTILNSSEKVILQFYSQRSICCHTGGSIAFGPDGLLYVSTGDNSTPFNEPNEPYVNHGFAPLDGRPGHEPYDALRSAGNTNDLRGKILRIKVKEDGSYEIPEGNLFPTDKPKTRPEIYVMGNRNPYRISVDQQNSFLYWGEVGPDAGADSLETRGPRGYDEFNQARNAGYFGWPLIVGNNFPYRSYNYATGESGEFFDPANPKNTSPNNTGLVDLPPAQPAFIWYPYAASPEFPQLGTGGRTAMAGPVYYSSMYPSETRYPDYYDGKLFIYEWIRNWIKVVTMEENGDFKKMEPFMESSRFSAPMDMELGPDGRIYVVEYGQGWFKKNPDAGLARIDYLAGNLPPRIKDLTVDKVNGNLPFTVTATVEAEDPEGDPLQYVWSMGDTQKTTLEPSLKHTFVNPGDHFISVKVMDPEEAVTASAEIPVYAGNEEPEVEIVVEGNRSFYFAGRPVSYQVKVKDAGDEVKMENLFVSLDQVEGKDLAGASMGHQVISDVMMGKSIMQSSDCKACHKINEKSIGPSFTRIGQFYPQSGDTRRYLQEKILSGGSGVWGENPMPAHPDMAREDVERVVKWIMSLGAEEQQKESLPAAGEFVPAEKLAQQQNTVLRLQATYTDEGGQGVRPLSGFAAVYLRNSRIDVADLQETEGFSTQDTLGSSWMIFPAEEAWLKLDNVDLNGISSVKISGLNIDEGANFEVEAKVGQPDGRSIGKVVLRIGADNEGTFGTIPLQVSGLSEETDIYLHFKPVGSGGKTLLKTIQFMPLATQ
jgi:cytochrome c